MVEEPRGGKGFLPHVLLKDSNLKWAKDTPGYHVKEDSHAAKSHIPRLFSLGEMEVGH